MSALTNVEKVIHVPARTGASVTVPKGTLIRFTDLEGHQPIDLWAFSQGDPWEFLSPEHTKPSIEKLFPRMGDSAYSNFRNPIVTLIEDNSPGQHDMEYAACDQARYVELGAPMPHASCQDNLHKELKKLGLDVKGVIQPWNLFTNFFINPDGTFTIKAPDTKPGDNCTMRVEMDCHVVISACPQDMNDTCGGNPSDVQMEIGS
ncbi:MAG: urea carboxylase-associated family protein [Alphaproteobacteria bacterium]